MLVSGLIRPMSEQLIEPFLIEKPNDVAVQQSKSIQGCVLVNSTDLISDLFSYLIWYLIGILSPALISRVISDARCHIEHLIWATHI